MAQVLVIDDDEELLIMLGMILRRAGHTPLLVGDPLEGLACITSNSPDLIILDLMMPHLSGFEVCRRIRNHADAAIANTPIMVLTARVSAEDRQAALDNGADAYVVKPVSTHQLTEHIAQLLTRIT